MPKKAFYFGVPVLFIIIVDQLTKYWIVRGFYLHRSIPVIQDFFHITYVRNVGAAFGIFSASDPAFRIPFFMIVPTIALLMIGGVFWKLPANSRMYAAALGLIFGGAVGNLIDRIKYGYVVDFLDFFWKTNHFPAFNVADSAICVGVGLLLLDMIKKEKGTSNVSHSA